MKKKTLASIFAFTAVATTVGTGIMSQGSAVKDNSNSNEVLLTQNDGNQVNNTGSTNQSTNESTTNQNSTSTTSIETTGTAVVINGDGSLVLMGSNTVKSNLVNYLSAGEMLTVQGQDNGWYKVTVQETGETGYIKAANVQFVESGVNDSLTILNGNGTVVNVSSNLRIRASATMESNIIGHLFNGSSFKIVGKEGQWYKINANGVTGFVYSEYVAPSIINAVNSQNNNVSTSTTGANTNTSSSNISTNNSNENANSSSSNVSNSSSNKATTNNSNNIATNKSNSSATISKTTVSGSSTSSSQNLSTGKTTSSSLTTGSTVGTGNGTQSSNQSSNGNTNSNVQSNATSNNSTSTNENVETSNSNKVNAGNDPVVVNNNNDSTLYNKIYSIVKANFWTNPDTEGSTMSMNMSQNYNKNGVTYYSVYVHTTNSDNGEASTAHYYISTNGSILNGNSFTNQSSSTLSTSEIKEAVSNVASEYLNGQVTNDNLQYNISMSNPTENNGVTYYAVGVYNGSVNSSNYITTIYVSPNGQVLGSLPTTVNNKNTTTNNTIVKRTRSTADVTTNIAK